MCDINRKGFLAELRNLLLFMDEGDRQRAMRRYEEMFDAAGPRGEEELLRTLRSPVCQVLIVEREYRKELEERGSSGESEAVNCARTDPEAAAADSPAAQTAVSAEQEETLPAECGETEERRAETSPGRVTAAVFLTLPLLAVLLAGLTLSLAVGLLGLAPAAALGAGGVYFAGYALGKMTFLPDRLLVGGAALCLFALALLFLWLGLWCLIGGIRLSVRVIAGAYGKVLWKEVTDDA